MEMKTYLALNNSQNKMNAISVMMMNANPNPSMDINHHFTGLRYGARQAKRKITEAMMLRTRNIFFVMRR